MISVAPRRRVAGWVVAVAVTMAALPLFAQDFYEQQLRAGKEDRAAGKLVEASDELRIAAFGFLDRPVLLSEALAHLALVQNALGYPTFGQTIDRFLDVERRFASWLPSATDAQTRAAFETLLLSTQRRDDLSTIPSLARLTRTEAQKVADLPVAQRAAAYEEGARKHSHDVEWPVAAATDAASRGLDDDAIRWSRRALKIDGESDAARAILVHVLTRRSECKEALRFRDSRATFSSLTRMYPAISWCVSRTRSDGAMRRLSPRSCRSRSNSGTTSHVRCSRSACLRNRLLRPR